MIESANRLIHRLPIAEQIKKAVRPLWCNLRTNFYPPHLVATEIQGTKLEFLARNYAMAYNIEHWFGEAKYINKISEEIAPTDTVLDIGSYIGLHALFFATKARHVFCIEPDPDFQKEIIRNASRNNLAASITVIPVAAWDKNNTLQLESRERYRRSSRLKGTVNANDNPHSPREFKRVIEVEGKTLDSLSDEIKQTIDIVKIDAEGAELHILRGGDKFWESPPRVVAVEIHPDFLSGWNQKPEEIDLFMSEKGYKKTFETSRRNELLTIYNIK